MEPKERPKLYDRRRIGISLVFRPTITYGSNILDWMYAPKMHTAYLISKATSMHAWAWRQMLYVLRIVNFVSKITSRAYNLNLIDNSKKK